LETYTIQWQKTGTPLTVGPVSSLRMEAPTPFTGSAPEANPDNSDYTRALDELAYSGVGMEESLNGVLNFGSRTPIFLGGFPSTFTRRLGGNSADFFYSGTFKYEDLTLGYIRIPNYAPPSQSVATQQLQREIDFMNANTDGLIVDEMRNTGGSLCFGEDIATRLIPYQFHSTGFQLRAYWGRLLGFYNLMINAKTQGAPADVIARYELLFQALVDANAKNRGLTEPVPICSSNITRDAATDASGNVIAYKKPLMLLVDEFSISTADSVAGMIQDASRGMLYGMRTNGAGGNNTTYDAGAFSEGLAGMTIGLQTRKNAVTTSDYPATIYIENVGVRPDTINDYMTRDNLLQNGAPFVHDFLAAMAAYVRSGSR
jgi:hypothetical protein